MSASLDQDAAAEVRAARYGLAGQNLYQAWAEHLAQHTPRSTVSSCADVYLKEWGYRIFTKFALQITDYKLVGAYRKFSVNNCSAQGDRILNFSNNNKVLYWSPTQGPVLRAPSSRRST
jgi:hypothetical protein